MLVSCDMTHNSCSYPLAYSLVPPLSVARWSMHSDFNVLPATMFFGLTMFDLSGAINVFLFLIIQL